MRKTIIPEGRSNREHDFQIRCTYAKKAVVVDSPLLELPHDISKQDPFRAYQRGVAEGIVEGRKQIYVWALEGLKTLIPLLKLEFATKTLLQGFMYQLDKFSKTGRHPSNEDE